MTARQLVIFSADSAPPSIMDLSGLLVGAGEKTLLGGTARVSVLVSPAWRVHALAAEFATRGLGISWADHKDHSFWVRTAYSAALATLTQPSFLDGHRLRLWFIAAGVMEEESIVLRLAKKHALARPLLAPLGLDGAIEPGPVIRLEGARKRARLADLIGSRPLVAPASAWP